MGKGTLTIYNASAGSGKTFTLAAIYLNHLFKSRYNYRHILAVTFTNKATAEMKSRILENLHRLGSGADSEYLEGLLKTTGKNEAWIRSEAAAIMNCILHDYSRFSVTTIDSFFQKLLRAFTREAGLNSGFSIEMDNTAILSESVDEVLRSASDDYQLRDWLREFAVSNIEEEKSWNLKENVLSLAREIFRENFKVLSDEERRTIEDKDFLLSYIRELRSIIFSFEARLRKYGSEARAIYSEYGLEDSMFYQKGRGIPAYIASISAGIVKEPNSYVLEITKDPPKWTSGKPDPALQNAIDAGLGRVLIESLELYSRELVYYRTAQAILANIYSLGILSDILKNVRQISTSENTFLLSEAGDFLKKITGGDQTSFIYEKAGNRYDNFMIDEFQDTSELQWLNFKPLIENSMSQGNDNLVVGDVKQSIYRWRNSDWKILGSVLKDQVDNERFFSEQLVTNWRSYSNIIRFNNTLFSIIPGLTDNQVSAGNEKEAIAGLYSEAVQKDAGRRTGGYVRIEFVKDTEDSGWRETVLARMPELINNLRNKGHRLSDIGIIVRDSRDGASVLKKILDYNNLPAEERPGAEINIVSNDSLVLAGSHVINFIVSVLSVADNPADTVSRALMLRLFLLSAGHSGPETACISVAGISTEEQKYYPAAHEEMLRSLGSCTLFEASERIIMFFGLGSSESNIPYLNSFQDLVLSFQLSHGSRIPDFLEWWENSGKNKSVVLPDNQDAVRILTIHKSKGLEFNTVILPFISWGLDHLPSKPPVLWVKPAIAPFNKTGIVPVKYGKYLEKTFFVKDYLDEKFSSHIDNINLLYVAFTRAKEALFGFSSENPGGDDNVAAVLKKAFTSDITDEVSDCIKLSDSFDSSNCIYELGNIVQKTAPIPETREGIKPAYPVSENIDSLRLRLHGKYYFHTGDSSFQDKINYGILMHEIFESIDTVADVKPALLQMAAEGKIGECEFDILENKINNLLSQPPVSDWFTDGVAIMREAGILLPSGTTKRPDRIVLSEGKTVIIDFKFGEKNSGYSRQLKNYRELLAEMGYGNIEGYIWYVDNNVIDRV